MPDKTDEELITLAKKQLDEAIAYTGMSDMRSIQDSLLTSIAATNIIIARRVLEEKEQDEGIAHAVLSRKVGGLGGKDI